MAPCTVTVSQTKSNEEVKRTEGSLTEVLTLRLVPKRRNKKKAVQWAEDVVDNENMGKQSSKKCCIFHKQQQPGEWDADEGDSDNDDCQDCQEER